ncbi:MAG: potassium transporter [Pseudomonadota bacterium]
MKRTMRETIWIAGMGYFGLRALQKLSMQGKERQFVLIDPATATLEAVECGKCGFEQTDAVAYLEHHLRPGNVPDWIIPALPLHLAAEWCLRRLGPKRFGRKLSLPLDMDLLLRNPVRGTTGDIHVSHASFRCPEDCPEPRDICTVTRSARKQNMFELLQLLRFPLFESLVIRSHQLAAGVGGYRAAQLFSLLRQVDEAKGDVLISTACRCHGVMTGLENQAPVS